MIRRKQGSSWPSAGDAGRRFFLLIRDSRLYRTEYSTFEDYCRERWGMSKTHANRLVESAIVIQNLGPIGPIPQTESQARPLAKLAPDHQVDAWTAATEKVGRFFRADIERGKLSPIVTNRTGRKTKQSENALNQ